MVPLWRSAPFWPLLCSEVGQEFAGFVKDRIVFPPTPGIVMPGLSGASLFNGQVPNTELLALRVQWY